MKKILLGILLLGLTVVLVFGAVNRTIAKTGDEKGGSANNTGANQSSPLLKQVSLRTEKKVERSLQKQVSQDLKSHLDLDEGEKTSGGQANDPQPQADSSNWVIYEGTASYIGAEELLVALPDGSQVEVEGRAWAFAREVEFTTTVGNQLRLEGFIEDGNHEADEFKIASIMDLTTGEWVVLRETNGRPAWAGQGWGEGRQ
jgi:hypothetical protein